ncbi:MAG: LacI family DNA-binding transcriptional regulator [Deltaproteobacteria bacterium]
MTPTIKDIARIANVSPTAVSIALNGRPGVSEKTRDQIRKIAKDLGYRPNYVAKTLISRRSQSIGLMVSNIADPFYTELACGVEKKANERGYTLLLCNTNRSRAAEIRFIEMLRGRGVDGIILSTVEKGDSCVKSLVEEHFPFVLVNRLPMDPSVTNRFDYVVQDNFLGGYQGTEHLYRLGHDRIAIIAGDLKTSTGIRKLEGVRRAMSDFDVKLDRGLVVDCGYIRDRACKAAEQLLALESRPTAFFCHDDNMALGVREAILRAGLRIPEDVALMGFDDIDTGALNGIDLTTITNNTAEMGEVGTRILIDKIEGTTHDMVSKIVLEAKLVIRKSCGYEHSHGYVR